MTDRILIRGLRLFGYHGVLAEYPEVLRVDLTLKKPQAPIQADFDWVGVTISRDRK